MEIYIGKYFVPWLVMNGFMTILMVIRIIYKRDLKILRWEAIVATIFFGATIILGFVGVIFLIVDLLRPTRVIKWLNGEVFK